MADRDDLDRPDLRLISGDGEDPQRDPIDVLADVLAGADGDPDHARYIAEGVVERGVVPSLGPGEWVRGVLDADARAAVRMTADLDVHVWRGDTLGWVADSDRTRDRVEAERAVLALHDGAHDWPGASGDCPTVRWLAYGHRNDAEGWRPEWTPDNVEPH